MNLQVEMCPHFVALHFGIVVMSVKLLPARFLSLIIWTHIWLENFEWKLRWIWMIIGYESWIGFEEDRKTSEHCPLQHEIRLPVLQHAGTRFSGYKIRRHAHFMWNTPIYFSGVNTVASNFLKLNATESWEFAHVTWSKAKSENLVIFRGPRTKPTHPKSNEQNDRMSGIFRRVSPSAPHQYHSQHLQHQSATRVSPVPAVEFLIRALWKSTNIQKPVMSLRMLEDMDDAKSNKAIKPVSEAASPWLPYTLGKASSPTKAAKARGVPPERHAKCFDAWDVASKPTIEASRNQTDRLDSLEYCFAFTYQGFLNFWTSPTSFSR